MLAALVLSGVSGCGLSSRTSEPAPVPSSRTSAAESGASVGIYSPSPVARVPATRAERTNYLETSHYADVLSFLDSLKLLGAPYAFGSIGKTFEGRDIPYVVASRPFVHTPAEARATGKPIVYVQANIHAGEVEGKEALLALLRDLAVSPGPSVLDSIVLIAVPIYNADGNERFGPQEKQRSEQNGPELVGQRPNAQGLDLNRDYVKAEAPETRASLAMFNAWNPDVFVDLHTTDGSFHGYALTYSPSLHPGAVNGFYTRELLDELRRRMRARDGYETFDYGNFADAFGREVSTDTLPNGWYTYDHRPRFGTNYYGLRQGISVLSEAFSHDPFERRVKSTYAFTRELLSLVAEQWAHTTGVIGRFHRITSATASTIFVRSALPAEATIQPVTFEVLSRTGDSSRTQPGVPRGLRRTGEFRTKPMPVFDRFVPTRLAVLPLGYLVPASDTVLIARLGLHDVIGQPASTAPAGTVEEFIVDSIVRAARPFQGHKEVRVEGHWKGTNRQPRPDLLFVPTPGTLAPLAAYLLDPESDDGFTTWNLFDDRLTVGRAHPILRLMAASAVKR